MKELNRTNKLMLCLMVGLSGGVANAGLPDSSDYAKDKTQVYVNEQSGNVLKSVNSILCMVAQTNYSSDTVLNKGYYNALVDESLCGNDSASNSGSSSQSGTSASGSKSYANWTVKSTKESADAPEVVTAFVHTTGGQNDAPMTIKAKMTITEAASDSNPLGIFSINFAGYLDSAPTVLIQKGVLKSERDSSKRVVLKFKEQESGQGGGGKSAALIKNGASGSGTVSSPSFDPNTKQATTQTFNIAYDQSFFKRGIPSDSSKNKCFSRKQYETSAWSYGVYKSGDGSRVAVNSGFPISTSNQSSNNQYGYLGYYGVFLPGSATVKDGDTVYKQSWSNNGAAQSEKYTLMVRGGKLKKHERTLLKLSDIKNLPLEGSTGPNDPNQKMQRVIWNDAKQVLEEIASAPMQSSAGAPAWSDTSPPVEIATNKVMGNTLGFYSQALGGTVNIKLDNCLPNVNGNPGAGMKCDSPKRESVVVFYKESVVSATDKSVPSQLTCFNNCPKPESAEGMSGPNSIYSDDGFTGHYYSFSDALLREKTSNYQVILTSANAGFGFNSGPLFESTQANIDALNCNWQFDPSKICGWKAWTELTVFYTWETGPHSYNQYVGAKKEGESSYVQFDPPLSVIFTYPDSTNGYNSTALDSKYKGTVFYLEYNGFGDLQGIPGKCFDPATGASQTDCSGGENLRWVPEFAIPAASVAGKTSEYLIKPLQVEQRMSPAPNQCSSLNLEDLSSNYPDLTKDWVDPNLGDEPKVEGPPKFVGGLVP